MIKSFKVGLEFAQSFFIKLLIDIILIYDIVIDKQGVL